jgi:hypothetical protein
VSFTPDTDFDGDRDDDHRACLFDRDDCRGDHDH